MGRDILRGRPPFELLTAVKNRISFLYLEYGMVVREQNSLVFRRNGYDYDIPAASLASLFLGTGTSITQPAVAEIARWNCNIIFVSAGVLGHHASFLSGSPRNSRNLAQQAALVSDRARRKEAARLLFEKRWGEPVTGSIRELQLSEGRRVKKLYREYAKRYGVVFDRRVSQLDFDAGHTVNHLLTAGNHLIYGIATAVITALGLSPGLGIIHSGNIRAFSFDIADLYKDKYVTPTAFKLAAQDGAAEDMRREFREREVAEKLIPAMVDDIYEVLGLTEDTEDESTLWQG